MRRYAVVQKARDADVFGILVGTLGVGKHRKYLKRFNNFKRDPCSLISSLDLPPSTNSGSGAEEKLHNHCRKVKPS